MTKMQEIPNKLYFRIGEVSDLVGVRPYVLRYWESEFPDIKPTKSKSGQRLYKRRDVEQLMKIKQLLYEERFTIDGARKKLKETIKIESLRPSEAKTSHDSRQLSVFEEHGFDTQKEEQKNITKFTNADKKIFTKIKKDLMELLEIVKS